MKREIIPSPQGSSRYLATNSDHGQNCSQAPCLLLGYLLLTIASNLLLKTIRDLIGKEGVIALTSQSFLITSQVISAATVLSFFRGWEGNLTWSTLECILKASVLPTTD